MLLQYLSHTKNLKIPSFPNWLYGFFSTIRAKTLSQNTQIKIRQVDEFCIFFHKKLVCILLFFGGFISLNSTLSFHHELKEEKPDDTKVEYVLTLHICCWLCLYVDTAELLLTDYMLTLQIRWPCWLQSRCWLTVLTLQIHWLTVLTLQIRWLLTLQIHWLTVEATDLLTVWTLQNSCWLTILCWHYRFIDVWLNVYTRFVVDCVLTLKIRCRSTTFIAYLWVLTDRPYVHVTGVLLINYKATTHYKCIIDQPDINYTFTSACQSNWTHVRSAITQLYNTNKSP